MHVFYTQTIANDFIFIEADEFKHFKVLRIKPDELVAFIDGNGNYYEGTLYEVDKDKAKFTITKHIKNYQQRLGYLHIAIAPTKHIDRIEWFVEKAVEIGIDEITPIICDYSERRVLKIERLKSIALAAAKQSITPQLPKINELISFDQLIANANAFSWDVKAIAHCYDTPKKDLRTLVEKQKKCLLLIGPEGDFSAREIQLAVENKIQEVSLGNKRLRTETAALMSCFIANL